MAKGRLAALSPNEEATLRQIAHGSCHPRRIRECDLARLKLLGLVEECGLALTQAGQQRLDIGLHGVVKPGGLPAPH
jgi:hypothetical protein